MERLSRSIAKSPLPPKIAVFCQKYTYFYVTFLGKSEKETGHENSSDGPQGLLI